MRMSGSSRRKTIFEHVWNRLGPRSEHGSATWWGFQAGALLFLILLLAFDGKWWMLLGLPLVALAAYHTVRAIKRRRYF
jgi:hypothetical protein